MVKTFFFFTIMLFEQITNLINKYIHIYFGHLRQRTDTLEKTLMLGKTEGRRSKGMIEDEMVGWHHWLDEYEFEQGLGVGYGREAWHVAVHGVTKIWTWLCNWTWTEEPDAGYCPWGRKKLDMTERLHFHFARTTTTTVFTGAFLCHIHFHTLWHTREHVLWKAMWLLWLFLKM